jgi:hypothetical protein
VDDDLDGPGGHEFIEPHEPVEGRADGVGRVVPGGLERRLEGAVDGFEDRARGVALGVVGHVLVQHGTLAPVGAGDAETRPVNRRRRLPGFGHQAQRDGHEDVHVSGELENRPRRSVVRRLEKCGPGPVLLGEACQRRFQRLEPLFYSFKGLLV